MNKLLTEKSNKLIKLAVRHAEISAEIKVNKDSMNNELSLCTGIYDDKKMKSEYDTCLTEAYSHVKYSRSIVSHGEHGYPEESFCFDETLSIYGCRHCNASRRLKRHIGVLKQERGRIHSAMTNIGKTLMFMGDL